jgi:hypothetical protein
MYEQAHNLVAMGDVAMKVHQLSGGSSPGWSDAKKQGYVRHAMHWPSQT